jgi:hypothetical protein
MQSEVNPDQLRKLKDVIKDKTELQDIVAEMTQFLADYGLKWMGVESNSDGDEE